LAEELGVPLRDVVRRQQGSKQLKDVFDYHERIKLLENAHVVTSTVIRGKSVLLVDDLPFRGNTQRSDRRASHQGQSVSRVCVCSDSHKERLVNVVFIGGSRNLGRLNSVIRARLDNIVDRGLRVVIGDANGSDRAVQVYLAERGHKDVVVYCMERGCRNNVGGWAVRSVQANGERGFDYYALKDAEMARDSDCGFMIWDGRSRGTLLNIQRLLGSGKPVVVYFSPDRECKTIRAKEDLNALLTRCPRPDRQRLFRLVGEDGEQVTLFPPGERGGASSQGMHPAAQKPGGR